MTLRSRNKLLQFFTFLSFLLLLFSLALFIFQYFKNQNSFILSSTKLSTDSVKHPFFQSNFFASLLSLFILLIYLPTTSFFVFRNFEKTQVPELMYFMLFLTGLLLQSLRIFVPLFNLYEGYHSIIILLSRIFFSGQILSLLSLWFISFYSLEDPLQQADKNSLIIIVVAIVLSFFMPIHTQLLQETFVYKIGFAKLFNSLKYSLIIITAIALFFRGKDYHNSKYFLFAFSYLLLINGSNILGFADSYALCIIGSLFLFIGNTVFLKILHAYYLWK